MRQIENSSITCPNGNCPEYVGGLYLIDKNPDSEQGWGVFGCSHTLISSNLVLTNGHCVPSDIQFAGASCRNHIKIYFPATRGDSAEKYNCAEVVSFSHDPNDDDKVKMDYAVLRLDTPTQRTPTDFNFGGVRKNQDVVLYKVNFSWQEGAAEGRIVRTECTANSNNSKAKQQTGQEGPVINVDSCSDDLIHGNSGTGVFDSSNALIAIFSWVYKDHPIGGGTNLACVPLNNRATPRSCDPSAPESETESVASSNGSLDSLFE